MTECPPFPKTIHLIVMLPETLLDGKRGVFLVATRAFQILILEPDPFEF
jgi:hypothetical protein